jgi:hypothetical protein
MTESIAEMVIPGTYIEVRAEGLISVGGIATGNVGVVGTAGRGPTGAVLAVGSLAEATDLFGLPDAFGDPRETNHPLTLVRTLEQAFAGGARNVFAVRVANGTPTAATLPLQATGAVEAFTLTAKGTAGPDGQEIADSSGTWGRDIQVEVAPDVSTGATRWRLTLLYRGGREVFEGATVGDVHAALASSRIVSVGAVSNPTAGFEPFSGSMGGTDATGGTDGADASATDVADGLVALEDASVNLLLVGGLGANVVGNVVLGHLTRTQDEGRERIAILGARASGTATDAQAVEDDADAISDPRVVLVAPGIVTTDSVTDLQVTLPPAYLAAAVAGRLATLAPHVSLTNKTVPVTPDVRYSTPLTQRLLGKRVLLVRRKVGIQVVKGITTSPKPFDQISIRRTVDFAKAGVRLGADPYIGRLNNTRVRAALQATLDGFLSQMVLDEMLVSYQLEVTATRPQEIAGICTVILTLRPTFSIDFIRVTMNLE